MYALNPWEKSGDSLLSTEPEKSASVVCSFVPLGPASGGQALWPVRLRRVQRSGDWWMVVWLTGLETEPTKADGKKEGWQKKSGSGEMGVFKWIGLETAVQTRSREDRGRPTPISEQKETKITKGIVSSPKGDGKRFVLFVSFCLDSVDSRTAPAESRPDARLFLPPLRAGSPFFAKRIGDLVPSPNQAGGLGFYSSVPIPLSCRELLIFIMKQSSENIVTRYTPPAGKLPANLGLS